MKFRELFGDSPKVRILELFLASPTTRFYLREIAKKTKLSVGAVFKHSADLAKKGILTKERAGKLDFYKLNRGLVVIKGLKRLHNISSDAVQEFAGALSTKAEKIVLFGSVARGEDTEESDVDILVAGDVTKIEVQKLEDKIFRRFKRKIATVLRTPEQYIDMPKKEGVLWKQIEKDGVVLYGL